MDTAIAQLLFAHRPIAYAITDHEFRIRSLGGATEEMPHPEMDAYVKASDAKTVFELSPELVGYEQELQSILDGSLPQHQLDLVNRIDSNLTTRYVLLQSLPIRDDNNDITGLLHIIEDVSELGELRQRLTQQRNDLLLLRDRFMARNVELSAANAELKRLDEMKSRFVSTAAHELRTPLSTITGYIEILLEPGIDVAIDEQRRCLKIIERNTKRLAQITDDLLDVTSLETGRIDVLLQPVELPVLIDIVIKDHLPILETKNQCIKTKLDSALPKVLCDATRTTQVLSNLLSNSSKYTHEGGTIVIHLTMADEEGFLQLAVEDDGIGIPAKDQEQLFDSLFRASNVNETGASGVGLGLYIARNLVELQGGQIWFESEEGVGTKFFVTYPIDDGLLD